MLVTALRELIGDEDALEEAVRLYFRQYKEDFAAFQQGRDISEHLSSDGKIAALRRHGFTNFTLGLIWDAE